MGKLIKLMKKMKACETLGYQRVFLRHGLQLHSSSGDLPYSFTASQIQDHEAYKEKNASAISRAISLAEYAFNRLEISE